MARMALLGQFRVFHATASSEAAIFTTKNLNLMKVYKSNDMFTRTIALKTFPNVWERLPIRTTNFILLSVSLIQVILQNSR